MSFELIRIFERNTMENNGVVFVHMKIVQKNLNDMDFVLDIYPIKINKNYPMKSRRINQL